MEHLPPASQMLLQASAFILTRPDLKRLAAADQANLS